MTGILLTPEEIEEITGFKNKSKQAEELRHLGIDHKIRRNGVPIVSRKAFEVAMGGEILGDMSDNYEPDDRYASEPNWAALDEINPRGRRRKANG